MSLGVAVIGAGVVGAKRAASAADRCRLEIVVDADADRAAVVARKHGARHSTRWEDAIADQAVEVVAVCTPNKFLAPISIAALRAGKHVLCEKPMGRNGTEAAQIQEAARASGCVFKLGFTLRFHPALRRAHKVCADGEIGPPFLIEASYGHGGRQGYSKEWRGDAELSGGGELLDQGVHLLDLARWFLGELAVEAAATPRWYWDIAPLEDNAFVWLRGGKEAMASLHTSWTMWKNEFRFAVYGRSGYVKVDGLGGSYGTEKLIIGRRAGEGAVPDETVTTFSGPDESWEEDWDDLMSSVETGKAPEVDADGGLAVMRLVDRVYTCARDAPTPSTLPSVR